MQRNVREKYFYICVEQFCSEWFVFGTVFLLYSSNEKKAFEKQLQTHARPVEKYVVEVC